MLFYFHYALNSIENNNSIFKFNPPVGMNIDNKGVFYGLSVDDDTLMIIQNKTKLTGTPTIEGTYDVNLTLSDGVNMVEHNFKIKVLSEDDIDGDGIPNEEDNWVDDSRYNLDSDNDGIPDSWEELIYGDLTTANATTDSDGDGYSDLEEFNKYTNLYDPKKVETTRDEAKRRIAPIIEELVIPEEMNASTQYTISWKVLGYDSEYTTRIALFDCTDKELDRCGSNYSENFYSELGTFGTKSTSTWSYETEQAEYFNYSINFTVPNTRDGGEAWDNNGTDVVVRFYQKTTEDNNAGKGSISLLIPGNITDRYYDETGRRVIKTICPTGGCN